MSRHLLATNAACSTSLDVLIVSCFLLSGEEWEWEWEWEWDGWMDGWIKGEGGEKRGERE
jgi:hypothetical protein